jgi:hypothetical protein
MASPKVTTSYIIAAPLIKKIIVILTEKSLLGNSPGNRSESIGAPGGRPLGRLVPKPSSHPAIRNFKLLVLK